MLNAKSTAPWTHLIGKGDKQSNKVAVRHRTDRACLSETAGSSATITPLGPMLLPLATVLGLTGAGTSSVLRSRRDTPYRRDAGHYQNHARRSLGPRPAYLECTCSAPTVSGPLSRFLCK